MMYSAKTTYTLSNLFTHIKQFKADLSGGQNTITQKLTALQSIAPIRHSTRHRISGAIFLLPISILLVGCPPWKITKILVNPQPLAGNETVFPVVLVAPNTSSAPPSVQRVVIEVAFERDPNFTNRIGFSVDCGHYEPRFSSYVHSRSSWLGWVASNRGHAEFLFCACSRIEEVGRDPSVELYVQDLNNQQLSLTATGTAQAKIVLDIEVISKDQGRDEYVTSSAAKPLEISCLKDSPIQ